MVFSQPLAGRENAFAEQDYDGELLNQNVGAGYADLADLGCICRLK